MAINLWLAIGRVEGARYLNSRINRVVQHAQSPYVDQGRTLDCTVGRRSIARRTKKAPAVIDRGFRNGRRRGLERC
jgi:hypothetical protein